MAHAHLTPRNLAKPLTLALMCTSLAALTACGGGGSSSSPAAVTTTVTPPPATALPTTPTVVPSGAPTFTPDVFENPDEFVAMCEAPRSGVDIEGNGFPDQAGSELIEKFWLRSWTEQTYLWNFEVVDQDPNNFGDRLSYFDILRTTSVTPSGEDLDDFHFSEPTTVNLERRISAPQSGYGARFTFISATVPRDVRVIYTEEGSPAAASTNGVVNLPRGARILEIDGVDVIAGADVATLNNGLFPSFAGETHEFVVLDPDATEPRTVTLQSTDLVEEPVNRTQIIETDTGRVGYVLFNTFSPFSSEESLNTAFTQLAAEGIDDLVLDLRYNGGGLLAVSAQLGYMVAGSRTDGLTYSQLEFNPDSGNRDPETGQIVPPFPFIDEGVGFSVNAGTPLATVDLPRVFILSTEGTCSASEALINGLRGINVEVVLIGDTTCGKPYGFLPTDNCGETYFTIQFRSLNEQGFGDYSDGFAPQDSDNQFAEIAPGCTVQDDLSEELGDENEALLSTALFYRANGTCPVASTNTKTSAKTYSTVRSSSVSGKATQEGAINTFGDPFVTTVDSYLDATMPGK